MNILASSIVKMSLKKIAYIELSNKQKTITQGMLDGNKHAEKLSNKMDYQEKRGTIKTKDFKMFFSVDAIQSDIAIEIKHINENTQTWFLINSIIQSSFYASLLKEVKYLDTPYFMIQQGHQNEIINLDDNPIRYFILMFGKQKILVEPSSRVLAHYMIKAQELVNVLKLDFTSAMKRAEKWDAIYKFKEDYLLKSITFKYI